MGTQQAAKLRVSARKKSHTHASREERPEKVLNNINTDFDL